MKIPQYDDNDDFNIAALIFVGCADRAVSGRNAVPLPATT